MSEQKNMAPDSSLASKGFNINPLDILRFLLSKWYWFALSVAIFKSKLKVIIRIINSKAGRQCLLRLVLSGDGRCCSNHHQ